MKKLGIKKIKDIFYLTFILIIGLFIIFIFFTFIYQLITKHLLHVSFYSFHFHIFNIGFLFSHSFFILFFCILVFCILLIHVPMLLWLFIGIAGIFYKSNQNLKLNSSEKMISVIVPAYNEEKVIKNILSDLISQNYTNFEILVIAHNCSDDTFQKAKEIVDQKIRIIEYNTQDIGKALALNKGLQEAKGEFVAQFDSDNRIKDSNFFKKAIAYFEDPNVKGIQCEVATSNPNSSFVSFMISLENDIFKETSYYGRSVIGLNCILAGTGVILRKKDLLEIGGWNNSLVEDFELSTRYSLKKKKIIFANDLKIYDEKPTTWHDMISQRRRWIKGYLQVFWKNITSFGNFVDYVYRFSPLSIFAWWMSTLIYAIYFFNNRLPIFNFINFFWISMTLIFIILVIYILFKLKKYDRKKILLLCFLYWLFEFHWLWVGLTGLTVNTWSNTKTVHHGDFSFMEGTKVEK